MRMLSLELSHSPQFYRISRAGISNCVDHRYVVSVMVIFIDDVSRVVSTPRPIVPASLHLLDL